MLSSAFAEFRIDVLLDSASGVAMASVLQTLVDIEFACCAGVCTDI